MSTAAQQENLMAALGPHDIALVFEPALPGSSIMTHPTLRGKLVCSKSAYVRLGTAFGQIELLCRALGEIPRGR